MNRKAKILFVSPSFSSFIQNDLDTLRRHFEVQVAQYKGKKKLLKLLIETLIGAFADVYDFTAVLFLKIFSIKSIVEVGGCEVVKVPKVGGVAI